MTTRIRGAIHVHSHHSYDGRHTISALADFFRARGLDFVCLSEHSDGLGADLLARLIEETEVESRDGLVMVPGIEFSCRRRLHILGLGVTKPVDSEEPLRVARHIRSCDGVGIVAHPIAYGADHPPELAALVDGIEVWNITKDGWLGPGAASLALWSAWRRRNPTLRGFGALDLHTLDSPSALEIEIEVREKTARGVLDGLRSGPLLIRGRVIRLSGVAPPGRSSAWGLSTLSRVYVELRRLRDRVRAGAGR